ncbi:helicase-related protein [Bacillus mesophilus]|nr:helicase-related protein [Bacillus mesophilus]
MKSLYDRAVQQTKEKVYEDIDRYLETSETISSFNNYINQREEVILQLWTNVWLNKVSSHASLKEKKEYLTIEKQFDIENLSRKQINTLFRSEIKNFKTFDVISWLDQLFSNSSDWERRYHHVRNAFLRREQKRKVFEVQTNIRLMLHKELNKLLGTHYIGLYVHVRYFIARQIKMEITKSGYLLDPPYTTFQEYLYDAMNIVAEENPYQFYKDDLEEKYESVVYDYIVSNAPAYILPVLSQEIKSLYQTHFGVELSDSILKNFFAESLYTLSIEMFNELLEEFVVDLLKLEKVPFDTKTHREILMEDLEERKAKIKRHQEEIQRQKEEEAKMLQDIFGHVYNSSIKPDIKFIMHVGETNTGKTFKALQRMMSADSGLYLAPLRLLALEVYDKLNVEGVSCSLKTGEEEKIINGARHISSTVEMFHEKAFYEVIVIDESQMIADKDRGFSWFKAITKANAKEVHIIGSYSMKEMIVQILGDSDLTIHEYVRDTPLKVEEQEFKLKHAKKGDALVCFSRRRVLETASQLQKDGKKVSMIYGSMPPETRRKQIQLFIDGENSIIVATDAIGMGLNLPIRRIVFLENEKFDGTIRRRLTSQEVKQIAGRAGRKGLYNVGRVAFSHEIKLMTSLLNQVDEPIQMFAIAPTSEVFERFQKYSRSLDDFFYLWDTYESPEGTKKASLVEERDLFDMIRGTMIEARLPLHDLYSFLHLPFSSYEPILAKQWRDKLTSIVEGTELPEPIIKTDHLEELELSYKAVGLHLLFLYRLDRRTETSYWEKVRAEISERIHDILKTDIHIKQRKCRRCGDDLPSKFSFQICDKCHHRRYVHHPRVRS